MHSNRSPAAPRSSPTRLLVVAFALALAGEARAEPDAKHPRLFTVEEVVEIIRTGQGPVIIDARSPQEYRAGHIPTALNLPHMETWGRIDELQQYAERGIVYYCTKGGRAKVAADGLLVEGFPNVGVMVGHFQEWEQRGLPIER